jgi:nitroreductase
MRLQRFHFSLERHLLLLLPAQKLTVCEMHYGQPCYPIDVAIAVDHITLAAVEYGLGSCWISMFNEIKVKEILDIPEEMRVITLLILGYPSDPSLVDKKRLPLEQIVKYEKW